MRKLIPLFLLFSFVYFSTFSQEIGTNDFRISDMGTDGVTSVDGDRAAIAYNSTTGQYLVVWEGDDVDGEQEIYGQLINATTGAEVGSDFRISNMTSTGVTIYRGSAPSVAYNSTTNEFLVVWTGDTNSGGLIDGETEVWGQRISAAGAEVGTDFRISDTNGTGSVLGLSSNAKVTWNATDNEYLVVWSATDPSLGMTYLEFEIFGQRLSSVGAEVGTNDFRISDMGGTGTIDPDAAHPDVVWNSTNNEYMVVWYGSESTANGFEIYAQRLTNAGAETGTNDFVISDMGDATTTYSAFNPEIAYNSTNNEYLVVWQADDNGAPVVDNEVEIFGQRLSNVGAEVGTNDFRISVMGNDAEATATTRDNFRGGQPDVAWNASNNMYMVVWEGEDDSQALDDGEVEIFGRLISNTNTLLGSQLRISNLGGEGNSNFDAGYPRVAVTGTGSALIVFEGENDTGSLADGEEEIWGQRFTVSVSNSAPIEIFPNPPTIESGTTSGTKISDLFVVDADQSNTFTYTLVAGAGSTDNASFAISGTELQANTTFNFATKSTYNLRIQVSDGTTTYQEALVMTVNAPVTTLVGDDFRISNMGPASNTNYDANAPDVAFNSTDDQFLVVWHGDNGTDNKNEIYGEILKGSDGTTVVNQFLISSNVAGNADYDASSVKVAYNSTNNQYLVVWDSDDNTGGMVNDEYEIFGRIVNANGTLSGSQIRISDAGGSGTTTAAASDPDVAYNATNNEYLVVWDADDTDSGVADNLREIYGQRISNVGAEIGTNDFRISNSTLTADSDANDPAVAWNSTNNEYLVVWDADPVNSHNDIIGQRISNVGAEIGADFVIIDAGASTSFDADVAAVVYNATNNQFLVAADADTALDGKNEIYTQLVSNTGTLVGSINKASDHVAGDALYDGTDVALAYLPDAGEYVAVWEGESNDGGQIDNEFEAYLQRITNLNVDTGIDDERVSAVGGTGSNLTRVLAVNAAYSTVSSRLLVVWQADDTNFTVVDNENEIFGQIWKIPSAGDTTAPVFENSTPSSSSVTQSGFTLGTDIDEGGSIYYVVVADGASAPSSAEVKAGTASGGGSAVTSGNAAVSTGGFTNNFSVTGLTAGTAYDVYAVAEDDEGSPNLQASPTKIDVTTTSLIALTITGLTGNNKVYDDNTTASASGTASLSGVLGGDTVNLTGSPTYTFASANVGTGITVNTLGFTISGADAGKYTLTQPTLSADITAKELTITGLTGGNKVYDGTTAGTATGTANLSGIVGADDVSLGGSPVFSFASANVGTGITLSTTGYIISGTDSGNYTLTQPTLSADITGIALTITGITGNDKVYDGTTAGSATGSANLSGVVGADDVSLGGSPVFSFASANVGTGITLNTTGYTISGTDSGNYTLTQPTLSADITAVGLTITGITGDDKVYDDTTAGSATGSANLSGIVGADDVSLGGSPVFTFASENVGTGITINTTGYTISGTDSGNYTLTQPTLSANITAKELTITGLTGSNKVYDGTTAATATGSANLSGVVGADDVSLGGSPVFTFASTNVGTGITINTSGYTISGTDSGNYTLTQPTLSADITGIALTITGLTGDNKVYDGTTTGSATGTANLSGVIGGDDVSLGGSPVFSFASANVGTGITINTTGYTISGTDAGKYTLIQPTMSADITAASLTVVGLTGDNKVYDGTTAGTATGTANLSGVVGADDVSLGGSPVFSFASGNVGTGITLNTTGYTISGTDSGNYTLTQPTLSADITAKALTITGITGSDKVYDGTTAGSATGTANLSGVVGADDVTLGGSPVFTFASVNVGTGITLNTTGYTISGTDSGNYTLTQPTLSGDITAASLNVTGLTGDDKVYDGTTTGSASGTANLSGVIGADKVSLGGSPTFTFASANVGTGITINVAGYTISGADSGNYNLTQPTLSGDITAKALTVTGLTGDDKIFDGTNVATASGTANLSGVIGADDVSLGGSPVFTFASPNVGVGITINTTGYTISGTDSGNYTLTQPTLSADINYPTVSFSATSSNGLESVSSANLSVDLSTAFASPVMVDYAVTGTATGGTDYTLANGTLTFNPGSTNESITIASIVADMVVELDETVIITLSNPTNAALGTNTMHTYTITNDDSASLSIDDVTRAENADGGATTDFTFTVTLNGDVDTGFTISSATANGTASAGSDYVTGFDILAFSGTSGQTLSYTVTVNNDSALEADETFNVLLSNIQANGRNVMFSDDTGQGIITNDDSASVTIADMSGNEDDGNITVTATLDNPVQGGFMVDVNTTDGTATTADSDYTAVSGQTLIFAGTAGETQTFTITPTSDTKLEANETLTVGQNNLSATSLAVVITDGATITINNDDTSAVTIGSVSTSEDNGAVTLTATLGNAVQGGFTVDMNTVDGTATIADNDYSAVTGETLIFAGIAGETQTFTVTPTADTKLEPNETVTISQSNLAGTTLSVIITGTAVVKINNDDSAAVTIADVNQNEDDGSITLTAMLDNAVQGGFTVDVNTADGTATVADGDYTSVIGQTLTFAGTAGEMHMFTVSPTSDTKLEANETIMINQNNLGATILGVDITDTATVTIDNDDATMITLTDITVDEDEGTINVVATLGNAVQGGFTLNASTVDATAIAPGDFTALMNQPIPFAGTAGETQNIALTITDDNVGEETEMLTMIQSSVSGTTLGSDIIISDTATVTIIDDDAPVVTMVSVPSDGNYGIGDNLDFTVSFTNAATISGSPSIPITIGSVTRQAVVNGTFTGSLTADFRYTIVEGDLDTDGISVGTDILLNGGSIVGSTNIDAILTLNNVASTVNVNVDGIKPTLVITTNAPDPTNTSFTATFTFGEDVTGFEIGDIIVGNGAASAFASTSATVYTATITPAVDGNVTLDVNADIAFDAVSNPNVAASQYSVLYDATRPTLTITSPAPDPTNMDFTVTFTFSEPVLNFEMADLVITNGTPSVFTIIDSQTYTALITPGVTAQVVVDVPDNVTEDPATNGNVAAQFSIEFDNTPPDIPYLSHISEYTCTGNVLKTGDNTLEISGAAEPLSIVEVFIDGTSIGTVAATNSGFFTFDHTGTTLTDGVYDITVTATDAATNTSPVSNTLTIEIDSLDSDGDGLPDFCDDDADGNGVADTDEDCDGDGIIDSLDTDNSACTTEIQNVKTYGFSPNGDGINDGWFIEGITAYPNSVVQVFNRSGKLVFKKKGYQNDWTAVSNQISNSGNNSKLPVGPYLFIIDLGDGSKPTRGWLYINY